MPKIDKALTKHISDLANIPISDQEAESLAQAFSETIGVVNQLKETDTAAVPMTHQVTGLDNVWREDKVDQDKMLTQEQALKNARKTYQGFFVVDRLISK